jgi:hypothetical protein
MIFHIFKKDLLLMWPFVAGLAAVQWIANLLVYRYDNGGADLWNTFNLLVVLQLAATIILVTTVVQLDAVPGVRQDWLIRPVRRRDLLLAKLLFVLILVQGPIYLGDFVAALADGFSPGRALAAASMRSAAFLFTFLVPALALAAVTRNFTEGVIGAVAAVAVFAALIQVINIQFPDHWRVIGRSGLDWIVQTADLLVAASAAAVVLGLQYFRRRTLAARSLTAAGALLCLLVNFTPWQPVYAIQQRLSPRPGAASALQLQFQPSLGRYQEKVYVSAINVYGNRGRDALTRIYLPIGITGLPADAVVKSDRVVARIIDRNGRDMDLGFTTPVLVNGDSVPDQVRGRIFVHDAVYERLRNTPLQIQLDYTLTLFRLSSAHAMPAWDGRQMIPETGRCETHLNRAGTAVQLQCLQAGQTPPCLEVYLEHMPSGRRNPATGRCEGGYEPFSMQSEPDALRRPSMNLIFRDPVDLAHYPVDGSQLKESRVVMKFYQPEAHFTRRVVIPNVRLSDWLPL